ncbi:MAG: aminotransferase-like domain-containing protein [Acidimicrobiales bacterium]
MHPQTTSRPEPIPAHAIAAALGDWSQSGHGTLVQRLAHALRQSVAAGLLGGGTRLPSERALAAALSVSRSTVTAALDLLREDGLVLSRTGSGSVIRAEAAPAVAGTRIAEHIAGGAGIDLLMGNPPDASHLPPITVNVAALVSAGEGTGLDPLGLRSLRTSIAHRASRTGKLTAFDEVQVTTGAQQGIFLAVATVAGPGTTVAVEDPTYPGVFDIVDTLGATAVPIATDAAGPIPGALETVLSTHRPAAVYLQTGVHNPTGRMPSPARLADLASVLDRHGATVIEDRALAGLCFDQDSPPDLASQCRRATVVVVESLSKVAWAGLRIGWMRAPAPIVQRTRYLHLASDLGPSVPSQLFALELMDHLDTLSRSRRDTLRSRVTRAVELVESELPDWVVDMPAGGSVLWPQLPVDDTRPFVQLAARHGVHVAAGSLATTAGVPSRHVRMCVDRPWPQVEAGIERLGRAWRDLVAAPPRPLG